MNETLQLIDLLSSRLKGHITVRSHDIGLEFRVHWKKGSFGKYFTRREIKGTRDDRELIEAFISGASKAHAELKKRAVDNSKTTCG